MPADKEIDLLYDNGPCLVVMKPGGLLTQAPPGIDSLETRIKRFLKSRDGKSGKVYLGVPHRLDRPVSGAIVFATHARAARRLSEQFEEHLVKKVYWCCVEGDVEPDQGNWHDHVRKIPGKAAAEVVPEGHPEGRSAVLGYRVLARFATGTMLEILLQTGRTHQIRVQAASRGLPLLGDEQYGSRHAFGPSTLDLRQRWIALHARQLSLLHPVSRERIDITAPLPAAWDNIARDRMC